MNMDVTQFAEYLAVILVIVGAVGTLESEKMIRSILWFTLLVSGVSLYLFSNQVYYLSLYLLVIYAGVAVIFILFMGVFFGDESMPEKRGASAVGWTFALLLFFLLSALSPALAPPATGMQDLAMDLFVRYSFALFLMGFLIFASLASVFSMVEEVEE